MQRSLTTAFLATLLISSSCSKSSNNSGGDAGAPAVEGLATTTTDANGTILFAYDPNSSTPQTIVVGSDSALKGTEITIAPGTLSIAANIAVEEGASATASVSKALGISEAPVVASPAVIVRTSDINLIPGATLAITLPLVASSSLTLAQDKLVVLSLYWTAGGVRAGVIPTEKITMVDGKAKFSVANFGQFQLAYLSEIPATIEANALTDIVSKRESLITQNLYIIGYRDTTYPTPRIGGYFKNSDWVPLTLAYAGGAAEPWKMAYRSGKMYVAGTNTNALSSTDPNVKETPGIWIDNVWSAYSLPTGTTRCFEFDLAFSTSGQLHVTANCTAYSLETPVKKSALWIDGVLKEFEKDTWGISADKLGNIYRTVDEGYWINETTLSAVTGNKSALAFGRTVVSISGDIYTPSYTSGQSNPANYGYYLNGAWKSDVIEVDRFVFNTAGEVFRIGNKDSALFVFKGDTELALDCTPLEATDGFGSTYTDGATVSRDGDVYVVGTCAGKRGYWKNAVFNNIADFSGYDIAIF